jgi:hypothetical protein
MGMIVLKVTATEVTATLFDFGQRDPCHEGFAEKWDLMTNYYPSTFPENGSICHFSPGYKGGAFDPTECDRRLCDDNYN